MAQSHFPLTREQLRSRRKHEVRAHTERVRRVTLSVVPEPRHLPATRGDCENGPRPCVHVSCKFNLYLDVSPRSGAIKFNRPNIEPDELTESCALDLADRDGMKLEDVAAAMNVTRERARQVLLGALSKLSRGRHRLPRP